MEGNASTAGRGPTQVHVKEKPDISGTDTDLEQQLKADLDEWGYRTYFVHDYRHLGYQLDFADPSNKIALEPGAVYWHTPDSCRSQANEHIGETPAEVYSPPTSKDIKKQSTLARNGWQVLWITEDGLKRKKQAIRSWLADRYE